jgi:error-prone DNA polymerase
MTSLHTHSWFSLLEGANSPETLVEQAVRLGNASLALTDTNNLYGAVPFVAAARARGIKPILGATLRHGGQEAVALIADASGYANLCRLLTRLHTAANGAMLGAMLSEASEGLHLLVRDPEFAATLRDAFGDRVWVEVVRPHIGASPEERRQLETAERLVLPLVASTAAHFAEADDYRIARIAIALRTGQRLDQLPATLPIGPAHRLVNRAELRWRFRDVPDAANNAERLADLLTGDPLPRSASECGSLAPKGADEQEHLAQQCERALRKKGLHKIPEAGTRLAYELKQISERRLAPPFLVASEIASFARRRRHPFLLRGAAGNSLVSFLLGITEVDPLRFGLAVDRFLRPDSSAPLAIELDFDPKVRDQAVEHVIRRYGRERTALVGSLGVFEPRSAFRKSAAMHGLDADQIETLCESLGPRVEWMLRADPNDIRLRSAPRAFPMDSGHWGRVLHDARRLLGRPHQLGVRGGGIAVSADRLDHATPLELAPDGNLVTQFDHSGLTATGVVTIDVGANRILGMADELQGYGHRTPKTDEPAILELLRRGETLGVTQLESSAMRQILVQTAPDRIEQVAGALALVRPSAGEAKEVYLRRHRAANPPAVHPPLEAVLAKQHGVMLFEDDAMPVIEALTGMSTLEAYVFFDRLRACESDDAEGMLADEFFHRAEMQGLERSLAEEQFAQLLRFRLQSISKSHAAQHSMLAIQALAQKVHHPAEFWAAALNNNHGTYPRRVYVEAMKQAGIRLLPPCVNRSQDGFTVEEGAVRVGLEAIGVLSAETRDRILANRRSDGLFRDLTDFTSRIELSRAMLSALIRCAAFDFAEASRDSLLAEARKSDPSIAMRMIPGTLFSDDEQDDLWTTPDAAQKAQLFDELATLGFVVGSPLLALFGDMLPAQRIRAKELPWHVGETATVTGMIACVRETRGSDGRLQHWVTLQDETGLIDLKMDAEAIKAPISAEAAPYAATGVVREKYDLVTLQVDRFEPCRAEPRKKGKAKSNTQQLPKFLGESFGSMPGVAG